MIENYLVRLYYAKSSQPNPAAAFIASKKVGGSVQRNRCKRVLKEIYRCSNLPIKDIDLIMSAKRGLYKCSTEKARQQISQLFTKINL